MNRISSSDYVVPSLSLASSRSKRAIPTKDTTQKVKDRKQIFDRINRPPIFNSIKKIQEKSEIHSTYSIKAQHYVKQEQNQQKGSIKNINRNVYLQREEDNITNVNEQQKTSKLLLRNPSNLKVIERKVEFEVKKIDVNKSLFERRMEKLFQQAKFYDEELNGVYRDEKGEELQTSIKQLQKMKEDAFNFEIGRSLVGIL